MIVILTIVFTFPLFTYLLYQKSKEFLSSESNNQPTEVQSTNYLCDLLSISDDSKSLSFILSDSSESDVDLSNESEYEDTNTILLDSASTTLSFGFVFSETELCDIESTSRCGSFDLSEMQNDSIDSSAE
jgi:hypothetical protein